METGERHDVVEAITMLTIDSNQVHVLGHVSRPVVGEGRQTPDRQMFFVNSRPCALPQIAKVINEVYKTYNISQSPFIFANVLLDTSTGNSFAILQLD